MSRSGAKRKRPKNQYLPWLRFLIRMLIVAGVILVILLVWRNWDKIAPEAILDWSETRFGDAEIGTGFPTAVEGNKVVAMGEVNQHFAVLSDTTLSFYNTSATRVVTRPHAFSNPVMHTAGRYVLLAEIGGSRFRLDTRRETVLSMDLENRTVFAACVLPSGMVAVVTDSTSQSYVCEIHVYNRKGFEVYSYQSRKYLLTNVSLEPDGKKLAAVGTAAEGGVLQSVLLLFQFSKEEPTLHSGSGLLLYDVNYFDNGTALAVGDKELWLVRSGAKEKQIVSLEGYEPVGYGSTPQLAGLVLQRAGSTGDTSVWTVSPSGDVWKSEQMLGSFRYVSCKNTTVSALTDSHLYTFKRGSEADVVTTPSDALLTAEYRGKPLILTLSEIKRPD